MSRRLLTVVLLALAVCAAGATAAHAAMPDITVTAAGGSSTAQVDFDLPSNWLTGSCTPASGSQFPIGDTAVLCSGTQLDGANPVPVADAFQVHVLEADVTPPLIAGGSDLTLEATSAAGAVVTYALPMVADDRPGVGVPQCTPASGSLLPVGYTPIHCVVSDAAGNTSSRVYRNVTVAALVLPDVAESTSPFASRVGAVAAPTRWALLHRGLRVPVSCSRACNVTVTLQQIVRVKRGAKYTTRYVRIASGVGASAPGARTITANLLASKVPLLRQRRAMSTRLVVTVKRSGAKPVLVFRALRL